MKNLLLAIAVLIMSCTSSKPVASSALVTYKVRSVEKLKDGSVVTLEGVKGQFVVHTDTLKVNDDIEVSWISRKK